eukprot:TRINITY_DN10696_c0_g1_i1.p2 TRINITY_DN10696_c0_g1~~TRINITY_DN10696_c0_g1_i1.p2  ORF type:complete len:243 (+),score=110.86 TRINITY_DN10696_c0_g1_i1:91-729(+)
MARTSAVLLVALVATAAFGRAAAAAADSEDPPPPTEAEVKRMKMKDLKSFLSDRGLSCPDCSDKNDFQRFALQNREKKILASKRPRKVSKEPLDVQWKNVAAEICAEQGLEEKACKPLLTVVQGSFEQHGRKISKQLHRELRDIVKTSMTEPYFGAGAKTIRQTVIWMKKTGQTSQGKIRPKIDNEIKKYLTAVAADNVNPMYEKIQEKDEL